jgi:hypothetical protein
MVNQWLQFYQLELVINMFDCEICAAKDSDQGNYGQPKIKVQSHDNCSWSLR